MPTYDWSDEFGTVVIEQDLTHGDTYVPADWIQVPDGGDVTFRDRAHTPRVFTDLEPGTTLKIHRGFHAIVSSSGRVRAGTGEGPDGTRLMAPASNTFYVASTGNDAGPGSEAEPLATVSEALRRMILVPLRGGYQAYTVHLLTDITDSPTFWINTNPQDYTSLEIVGTKTLLGTGSITAYQAYNATTKADQLITDSALPTSWTASGFVGGLMVLTSGPNAGAWAWIYNDLGTKQATITPFWDMNTFAVVTPTTGTTYSVYSIPKIHGALAGYSSFSSVNITNVELTNTSNETFLDPFDWFSGSMALVGCRVDGNDTAVDHSGYGGHMFADFGCTVLAYGCDIKAHVRANHGSWMCFDACHFTQWGTAPTADGKGSKIIIEAMCVGHGEQSFPQARNQGTVEVLAPYAIFGQIYGIRARQRGELLLRAKVWGKGITLTGLHVGSEASVSIDTGMIPDLVNSTTGPTYPTTQIDLGGTAHPFSDYAATLLQNAANLARLVPYYSPDGL